jgi:hypothetical protein
VAFVNLLNEIENMKYVGQTGRPFLVRFQEHFRDYKYANNKSKFPQHSLDNSHSIGPIENIMDVLFTTSKFSKWFG